MADIQERLKKLGAQSARSGMLISSRNAAQILHFDDVANFNG